MPEVKFQTIVDIPEFHWKTGYGKKNMFIGSCFTENVGTRMLSLKYITDVNPFGILYNPVSVANGLRILINKKFFEKENILEHGGLWHSFFHHGKFSAITADKILSNINKQIKHSSAFLRETDFLFLTFGTAWVYEYKETGQVVSNCHKIPAKEFKRFRLSVEAIVTEYCKLLFDIKKINPGVKVVFTVSPIRHWKDGAIENQRSKATLFLAIDEIIQKVGAETCVYFPAYEIVMDELRDYRFYAEDMLHISDVAIKHIWEIFEGNLIEKPSYKISEKVQKIVKAIKHKPFNPTTKEHLTFLVRSLKQAEELEQKYPNLNFELEKKIFNNKINEINNKSEHF